MGMFTRFQHALKSAVGRQFHLTSDVHDELETWHKLVRSLSSRATHLHDLQHLIPTWMGRTNTSGYGMGGVF